MRSATVVMLGLALGLAACSGERKPVEATTTATLPPPGAPATSLPPVLPTPARPEGADAVDAALAAAQAFNAKVPEDLAAIDTAQARIRALAAQATTTAGRIEAAPDAQRAGLITRARAARAEAEALRKGQADAAAAIVAPATTPPAWDGALALCAATPELGAYEGCANLKTEHDLLTQNLAALTARHQAAEAAWRDDQVKLTEAMVTIGLAR